MQIAPETYLTVGLINLFDLLVSLAENVVRMSYLGILTTRDIIFNSFFAAQLVLNLHEIVTETRHAQG